MKLKNFLFVELLLVNSLSVILFFYHQNFLNLLFLVFSIVALIIVSYFEDKYNKLSKEKEELINKRLEDLENKVSDLYLASGFVMLPKNRGE